MTDGSTPLKQPLYAREGGSPNVFSRSYYRNKFTGKVAACTMPTKYREGQQNLEEWCLCSCMLLLEACNNKKKKQTEGDGESSRLDLNNLWPAGHTWLMKQIVWPARW